MKSTRRFFALPGSVLLSATGLSGPLPVMMIRLGAMLISFTIKLLQEFALFFERETLVLREPVLSVLPSIRILLAEAAAISPNLYGYDPQFYPLASIENQWFEGGEDTVVLAVSTGPRTFNSIQATDVYSQYCAQVPMDGLVGYTPSAETVLPASSNRETWMIDNFGSADNLALYPRMATSLGAFSDDGLQFNITVRDDIDWHDGRFARVEDDIVRGSLCSRATSFEDRCAQGQLLSR